MTSPGLLFSAPNDVDTPEVVVDVDRVDANIAAAVARARAAGVTLRPHFKTPRSVSVARRFCAQGVTSFTVATIGEADVLVRSGIRDVFIAYPVWAAGPKASRLRSLAGASDLRVGADSVEGIEALARAVGSLPIGVLIEVDSGEHRTGVEPHLAGRLAARCRSLGLRLDGVFTHGGHAYDDIGLTERASNDEVDALMQAQAAVEQEGIECAVLSAGSTPTSALTRNGVTEERPGSFVFGDAGAVALGAMDLGEVALMVLTTVVSATDGRIVLDAGTKAIGNERAPYLDGPFSLPDLPGARVTAIYEHHAVVDISACASPVAVGAVVRALPNHVCPVVNLVDELVVVARGEVVDHWRVDARARNR